MSIRKPGLLFSKRRPGTTDEALSGLRAYFEDESDILFAYAYTPETAPTPAHQQIALWFDPPHEVRVDDYIENRIAVLRKQLPADSAPATELLPLNHLPPEQRSTILCRGTLLFSKDEGVRRRLYISRSKAWTPLPSLQALLGARRSQR